MTTFLEDYNVDLLRKNWDWHSFSTWYHWKVATQKYLV